MGKLTVKPEVPVSQTSGGITLPIEIAIGNVPGAAKPSVDDDTLVLKPRTERHTKHGILGQCNVDLEDTYKIRLGWRRLPNGEVSWSPVANSTQTRTKDYAKAEGIGGNANLGFVTAEAAFEHAGKLAAIGLVLASADKLLNEAGARVRKEVEDLLATLTADCPMEGESFLALCPKGAAVTASRPHLSGGRLTWQINVQAVVTPRLFSSAAHASLFPSPEPHTSAIQTSAPAQADDRLRGYATAEIAESDVNQQLSDPK